MISIFIASFYVKATETKNKIKQSPVGLGGGAGGLFFGAPVVKRQQLWPWQVVGVAEL